MTPLSTSNPNLSSLSNNELGSDLTIESSLIHQSSTMLQQKSHETNIQESFLATAKQGR